MKQTMDAVYEDGVFKPMKPPKLSEGQHVRIKIETPFEKSFDDLLELAAKVYEGLSADDIDGIEKIAHGRRDFLGDRTGA
ncbi:MAG: DUF104 domain-containing protein [Gemmatimonadetes bacterium]|nr:DUF104 domain-containing protein [Gemmatimonadota bacterium]MYK54486.1 DUF104 domain-containing protein [Gemmatimonadota bacterium]